jgi:hypothetical protein
LTPQIQARQSLISCPQFAQWRNDTRAEAEGVVADAHDVGV